MAEYIDVSNTGSALFKTTFMIRVAVLVEDRNALSIASYEVVYCDTVGSSSFSGTRR